MPMRGPREISESYWVAECRRDVDAVLAHYRDDAFYEDGGGRYQGRAAIRGFYEASARAFPGLDVTITRDVAVGDLGALEFVAVLLDADGRRSVIRGVNIVEVRDGRFVSVRSYEDAAEAMLDARARPPRITSITLRPHIVVGAGPDEQRLDRLVEKAHATCFISNTLACDVHVEPTFVVAEG